MNLYKIFKAICLKSLPIAFCVLMIVLLMPKTSVKQVHIIRESCKDSRIIKLQQRYSDCSFIAEFFLDGEIRMMEETGIPEATKQQLINEYRIIQDTLLLKLHCIFQEEIRYPK